jgi:hypothetical protein
MDAPTYFLPPEEAATIDDIEPSEMITEGVILDFTDTGPSERISKAALKTEAERYGVQAGDVVILFLGFDEPIVFNSVLPLRGVCDDERPPLRTSSARASPGDTRSPSRRSWPVPTQPVTADVR